jgi:hypothetical protein
VDRLPQEVAPPDIERALEVALGRFATHLTAAARSASFTGCGHDPVGTGWPWPITVGIRAYTP